MDSIDDLEILLHFIHLIEALMTIIDLDNERLEMIFSVLTIL